MIIPIVKRGERKILEDYRRVTLMASLYKVYAIVLAERLRKEAEKKGIIPQNQTGFRKGMGTIDNVYVLNYLVNRQIAKRKGKMVVMFIDLKAAFDSVDRGKLVNAMKEKGIRIKLIERIEEMMRETRCRRSRRRDRRKFLDCKRGKTGVPIKPNIIQHHDSGHRGGNGKDEMRWSQGGREKGILTVVRE